MINKGLFTSDKQDWTTPQEFFDRLNTEFDFTIDVAASVENAKCPRFYTQETSGLTRIWDGVVFCNPPYGRTIGQWVRAGHFWNTQLGTTVVMLLPARTDTKWWHDYVMRSSEIRFIKGRLKFGDGSNSAPFPSCVVVFKDSPNPYPAISSMKSC